MLFSINEKGDLNIDKEKTIFSDFVVANERLTNFRIAKTILLTHLVHKEWFKKEFLLHKRLNIDDDEIRRIIKEKIEEIFLSYPNILPYIDFSFMLNKNILTIVFFKTDSADYGLLLEEEIKIS